MQNAKNRLDCYFQEAINITNWAEKYLFGFVHMHETHMPASDTSLYIKRCYITSCLTRLYLTPIEAPDLGISTHDFRGF